jgi:glycosyltransferase involved in cell wall biosynthesis
MKLLIASSTLNKKNGYGNITYELLASLNELGHEITLLLPEDDPFQENDLPGVSVERVLPPYLFRYKSRYCLKHLLWRYKSRQKFDVVHSLFAFPYAPLMCREAKRLGLPFIMGAQGTYGVQPLAQWPEKYALKHAYRNADYIHVPSEYTRDTILKEASEYYDIKVLHNGVNFKRFANHSVVNVELQKRLKGKKVLLTVGELKSRKGQDIIIKALPEVVKQHKDVLYVMAGYPSWQEHLEKLATDLGVREYIHITGPVSDQEILDLFHRADIYVHTPRVHKKFQFEGFGIVYLEAGACGKPSVGTDAGGIKDALLHEKTGFVAGDEDVKSVSKHILQLIEDESVRLEYGATAKQYAANHDWSLIAQEYVQMYKSTVTKSV